MDTYSNNPEWSLRPNPIMPLYLKSLRDAREEAVEELTKGVVEEPTTPNEKLDKIISLELTTLLLLVVFSFVIIVTVLNKE